MDKRLTTQIVISAAAVLCLSIGFSFQYRTDLKTVAAEKAAHKISEPLRASNLNPGQDQYAFCYGYLSSMVDASQYLEVNSSKMEELAMKHFNRASFPNKYTSIGVTAFFEDVPKGNNVFLYKAIECSEI